MPDVVKVEGLRVATRIGVAKEERSQPQELLVDIELETSTKTPAASDDIADAVDYRDVIEQVHELAKNERSLLERFAEDIAHVARQHPKVTAATVRVWKPSVAASREAKRIGVEITR